MTKSDFQLTTPVAFIIFNRPDTTARVFEAIRQARPPKLLVIADGPRPDRKGEAIKCEQTRAIISQVDWPCEVLTDYAGSNLGCKRRVSSGLDWVFKTVEEAIILEDDCLPHPTFFQFCEELLYRYRDDERVMMISGVNFQFGRKKIKYSYYFSQFPQIWGWASWRRAWSRYDVKMNLWPEIKTDKWLDNLFHDKKTYEYWIRIFNDVYNDRIDTWDFQWNFAAILQHGLSIVPNVNLVSNIGFTPEATHTTRYNKFSNMDTFPMTFPMRHPHFILPDIDADRYTQRTYAHANLLFKVFNYFIYRPIRKIGLYMRPKR